VADGAGACAPELLGAVGSANGYAALGLDPAGDCVYLDEGARALKVYEDGDVLEAALTAGHPGLVDRVTVLGEDVVVGGWHVSVH